MSPIGPKGPAGCMLLIPVLHHKIYLNTIFICMYLYAIHIKLQTIVQNKQFYSYHYSLNWYKFQDVPMFYYYFVHPFDLDFVLWMRLTDSAYIVRGVPHVCCTHMLLLRYAAFLCPLRTALKCITAAPPMSYDTLWFIEPFWWGYKRAKDKVISPLPNRNGKFISLPCIRTFSFKPKIKYINEILHSNTSTSNAAYTLLDKIYNVLQKQE